MVSTEKSLSAPAPWQPLDKSLADLRQECAGFEQLLDGAFGELEQLREEVVRKAQELQTEQARLTEQRKQLHEHQAEVGEELRRLRAALEGFSLEDGVADGAEPAAVAAGDPVIDSVMAQFTKLQKQIAQRRQSQRPQR